MKLNNISKEYQNKNNKVLALDHVNLDINENGLTIILGPSGSGKTTLLNIIAQVDTDYSGQIIDPLSISYLTQKIELFDSLSVVDNIKLLCSDITKVNEYLHRFNLTSIKHKKIKKCSQGQKRRVQVLCAYLNDKQMLVLDEPTSALDHDNAINIMEMLKDIAHEKPVIMITHDIALANAYADRLIEIDNGKIIKDSVISRYAVIDKTKNIVKKQSITDNLRFVFKDIISRPFKLSLTVALSTICLLALYLMINAFISVNKETDYLSSIKTGDSIIVTYNDATITKSELINGNYQTKGLRMEYYQNYYIDYDNIPYNRLQDILISIEEIAAVEVNADHELYTMDYDRAGQEIYGKDRVTYKMVEDIYYEDGRTFGKPFKPISPPFISNVELPSVNEFVQNDTILLIEQNNDIISNSINMFHVVDQGWNIPLLYGEPLSSQTDIIIDTATAELFQNIYHVEDIESLINSKIEVRVLTWAYESLLDEKFRLEYANENYEFVEKYYYTIKGITNLENEDMRLAFVKGGILEDQILSSLVVNSDALDFKDVKFILKPNSDYEKVCNEINEYMGLTRTSFVQKSKVTADNVVLTRNNEALITYIFAVVILLFGSYYLNLFMNKKVFIKEQKLLKEYGYHNVLIEITKLFIIMGLAVIIASLISNVIIINVNQWASIFGYSVILSNNLLYLFLAVIIVTLVEIGLTMSIKLIKR